MIKSTCKIFTLFSFVFLLSNCFGGTNNEDTGVEIDSKVEILSNLAELSPIPRDGKVFEVEFTVNSSWHLEWEGDNPSIPDWVTVYPLSGKAGTHTVTIKTTPNQTDSFRVLGLVIVPKSSKQKYDTPDAIRLYQDIDPFFYTSTNVEVVTPYYQVSGKGERLHTIRVQSNLDIKIDSPEWVTYTKTLVPNFLKVDYDLVFQVEENRCENPRSCNVRLSHNDFVLHELKIDQDGHMVEYADNVDLTSDVN